jgi:polyribonucleotide nucleotidyltransferase
MLGERPLIIESGKLAMQAGGAVTMRYGDTIVLVTACVSSQLREGIDFFPLTVDYEERHSAAGKIPGSFFRREGRPSQDAILTDRLTDRSLRPLFPKSFHNDVQIVVTVLSADLENDPDILAIAGASAALTISPIPFNGPVSAVRVGYTGGEFVLNPTFAQLNDSSLDLVVASTADSVVMVEAGAKEVPESLLLNALKYGSDANREIIQLQHQLRAECGKPKMDVPQSEVNPEVEEAVSSILGARAAEVTCKPRAERQEAVSALKEELGQKLGERFQPKEILSVFDSLLKRELRSQALERGIRAEGRGLTEVRPISCEVGFLPRTHGSGLFRRGLTQVLTTATMGSAGEGQLIDTLSPEERKRFLHHYNFPPYSNGEIGRLGGTGRREVGHGALAERALAPVIPSDEEFPYTIRLVSEVLSSNGSTSMASVCASSLSLMDAGVPIKAPVAGVAMGLITDDDKHAVLTDIEGLEDAYGDMDFKVAGTAQGVTALQMDIKLKGISYEVIEEAVDQARDARLFILGEMNQTISSSRPELNRYAPRVYKITINPDKIGSIIGPGGKMIRSISEETKTTINVENDGTVLVGSSSEEMAQRAIKIIEGLTREAEVGGIYTGKVARVTNFGAFVEIFPGKEGLVHISELADYRVASVEDVVKVGDEITVMVTEIDRMGRINLSRRAVFQGLSQGTRVKDSLAAGPPPRPQGPRPPRHEEQRRPGGAPPPRRYPDRGKMPPGK